MRGAIAISFLLFFWAAAPALAEETTFLISGITCDLACTARVRRAFQQLPGVEQVVVDFAARQARVVYQDSLTDPDRLASGLYRLTDGRHRARPLEHPIHRETP